VGKWKDKAKKIKFLRWLLPIRTSFNRGVMFVRLLVKEIVKLRRAYLLYYKFQSAPDVLLASLRTHAHIIDKGLQSPEWEPGRGEGNFRLAKKISEKLKEKKKNDPSFTWAVEKILAHQERQVSPESFISINGPYSPPESESAMWAEKIILGRRSIRSFVDKPIPENVLARGAELACWAPA